MVGPPWSEAQPSDAEEVEPSGAREVEPTDAEEVEQALVEGANSDPEGGVLEDEVRMPR